MNSVNIKPKNDAIELAEVTKLTSQKKTRVWKITPRKPTSSFPPSSLNSSAHKFPRLHPRSKYEKTELNFSEHILETLFGKFKYYFQPRHPSSEEQDLHTIMASSSSSSRSLIIRCALVARGPHVVCEYDATEANPFADSARQDLTEICRECLAKIPRGASASRSSSYIYMGHTFSYSLHGELLFLCIADPEAGVELVSQFLRDFRERFEKNQHKTVTEQTLLLRGLIVDFNSLNSTTKIAAMERELEDVTKIMKQNIDTVLERGEKMNSLVGKTDALKNDAFAFKKSAYDVRKKQWWDDMKGKVIGGLIALVCLYFVLSMSCGWNLGQCFSRVLMVAWMYSIFNITGMFTTSSCMKRSRSGRAGIELMDFNQQNPTTVEQQSSGSTATVNQQPLRPNSTKSEEANAKTEDDVSAPACLTEPVTSKADVYLQLKKIVQNKAEEEQKNVTVEKYTGQIENCPLCMEPFTVELNSKHEKILMEVCCGNALCYSCENGMLKFQKASNPNTLSNCPYCRREAVVGTVEKMNNIVLTEQPTAVTTTQTRRTRMSSEVTRHASEKHWLILAFQEKPILCPLKVVILVGTCPVWCPVTCCCYTFCAPCCCENIA